MTNLVELIRIDDKRSKTVARKFAQCWLTHYPWPQCCVHNPGTEITGPEFQALLQNFHIRDVCTTAKKSQSNAVCERMIHNRKYSKDILPNTWGHIAKYMGTHCQIHGDTLPNTWGHIAKYMGTRCQHKIYVQHIWGQIANTKKNIWNIIDNYARHASRSALHFRQQPRQSCV